MASWKRDSKVRKSQSTWHPITESYLKISKILYTLNLNNMDHKHSLNNETPFQILMCMVMYYWAVLDSEVPGIVDN